MLNMLTYPNVIVQRSFRGFSAHLVYLKKAKTLAACNGPLQTQLWKSGQVSGCEDDVATLFPSLGAP